MGCVTSKRWDFISRRYCPTNNVQIYAATNFCCCCCSRKLYKSHYVVPDAEEDSNHSMNNSSNIDNFVNQATLKIDDKVESLKLILSERSSRAAFLRFLKTEYSEENLLFLMAADEVMSSKDDSELSSAAEHLIQEYILPGSDKEVNVSYQMKCQIDAAKKRMQTNSAEKKTLFKALHSAQSEVIHLLAMGAYPRFLQSGQYREWRSEVRKEVKTVTSEYAEKVAEGKDDTGPNELSSGLMRALEAIDKDEVHSILAASTWLKSLLVSCENLPICVSLSTASQNRRNFPLIFVNKQFEKITGYPRSEIIGRNCKFLQCAETEPESVQRLSAALRDAKPVKAYITNARKDGTIFKNLLAMKPIFDQTGSYRYVVGLQFSISTEDSPIAKLVMLDELLQMLPDKIVETLEDSA